MKNTIKKDTYSKFYVLKNDKFHCLYYHVFQENKGNLKRYSTWQNGKYHNSYNKNQYNERFFNGNITI